MISYIFILEDPNLKPDLLQKISLVKNHAVWIGVTTTSECETGLNENLSRYGIKYNLIVNSENFSDYYKIDQFKSHLRNGWTYIHKIGEQFRSSVRDDIKNYVDNGGKFAFVANECEAINDSCFYSLIYKMLGGNSPEQDQWINFYDKVEQLNPDMIKRWDDL